MTKNPKPETYVQQVSGRFKCPGCGCIKPEKKGKLAKLRFDSDPALWCILCIKDFGCIVVPEQKELRNG